MKTALFLFFDFFMIKEIYDNWRRLKRQLHTVIIADIREAGPPSILPQGPIESFPIRSAAPDVYGFVQRDPFWILFPYILQNTSLITAAKVEVFQPHQVTMCFYPLNDGLAIGDAWKNRRNETSRSDTAFMKDFHGVDPALDTDGPVHILLEILVQGVNRKADPHVRKGRKQIKVPQYQIGFRLNAQLDAASLQLLQESPCTPIRLFLWIVWVRYGTKEDFFPTVLLWMADYRPIFDV